MLISKRLFGLLFLLIVLVFGTNVQIHAASVFAQITPPAFDLSTPQGLLTALLFPVFVINWLVTHGLNTWPRWVELPAERQHLILFVLAVIIAVLAYAALHLIPGTVFAQQDIQNIYAILYALFTAYISGQFSQGVSTWGQMRRARLTAERFRLLSQREVMQKEYFALKAKS